MHGRKKRKDYAFRHHFNEKPSIVLGCPGPMHGFGRLHHITLVVRNMGDWQCDLALVLTVSL